YAAGAETKVCGSNERSHMSTQTTNRVIEGPLSIVVRPGSEAEASYRSAVLAPGFGPEPGLDLRFFGGKTLPHLRYSIVYLGGYHGSIKTGGTERYYAVAAYSEGDNGIVAFDEPWKNVCATLYHELQETRTDPDVEDAIRLGSAPGADRLLGWYSPRGGEIGDIPMAEAGGDIARVMKEVPLADGSGTVPIQLMWSNAVGGPEGPTPTPRRPR